MLLRTELGVSLRVPVGDEDLIPPEPFGAPGLWRDSPSYRTRERADGSVRRGDRNGAYGPGRPVLIGGEHLQETLVPYSLQKPLGQSPGQSVPALDDKPRILDEYGVIREAQSLAGGNGLGRSDLRDIQGLWFGEVEGDALQLYLEDLGSLPRLVQIGGDEEGFHATESTICASFVVESPVCAS